MTRALGVRNDVRDLSRSLSRYCPGQTLAATRTTAGARRSTRAAIAPANLLLGRGKWARTARSPALDTSRHDAPPAVCGSSCHKQRGDLPGLHRYRATAIAPRA